MSSLHKLSAPIGGWIPFAELFRKVVHAGVNDRVPPGEERFVVLQNSLCLVAGIASLLNAPISAIFLPDTLFVVALQAGGGLLYLLLPALTAFGFRLTARRALNILSLITFGLYSGLHGVSTYSHLFSLLAIVAAFFQFPPQQTSYKYLVRGAGQTRP